MNLSQVERMSFYAIVPGQHANSDSAKQLPRTEGCLTIAWRACKHGIALPRKLWIDFIQDYKQSHVGSMLK